MERYYSYGFVCASMLIRDIYCGMIYQNGGIICCVI